MAAPPPSYPAALKPEIGPDGLARDSPVIAYTEKVRIPAHSLAPSLDAFLVHQWFSVCWVSGFLLVGWLVRRSFWRSSCSWRSKPFLCSPSFRFCCAKSWIYISPFHLCGQTFWTFANRWVYTAHELNLQQYQEEPGDTSVLLQKILRFLC